jgi:glycosyltransferase involved in cell wall biosynthesis
VAVETEHRSDATPAVGLDVRLDAPLPETLAVGAGTALFVCGTCFAPGARVSALTLLVDGEEQPLMASGMPRLDLLQAEGDPAAYRAGFWGFARIAPRAPGPLTLALRARPAGGGELDAELAQITVVDPPDPLPGAPLVAICMAAFEPPLDLFRRQVESIRAQTVTDWICVVSDDCSDPERFAEMRAVLDDDPRFVLSRSERRRGFYHNFERAMALAPRDAGYVTLADQDDVWDADKLETLMREVGDAQLVYSDQRIVSPDGELLAGSYWEQRENNHSRMLSLLVANCVTGAASLFPRALLDDALPLPPAQFTHFHDHWLAVTALALGEIRYVDRPLYGYVQHANATIGHATATRRTRLRERWYSLQKGPRERIRLWRMHYFIDACRLLHFATVLEMRCGARMPAPKRRVIARFVRAERSALPVPGLFVRGARELARRRPQTPGAEWMLAPTFGWCRLIASPARDRPKERLRIDALPPSLVPRPRARLPGDPDLRAVAQQIEPLRLAVRDSAPARVNVLVPSLDGRPAPLELARRLADRGLRVRVVTVDAVGAMPRAQARDLEPLELEYGRESLGVEISRTDAFVATTWWTAHVARAALRSVEADRFLYLIEDYAPLAMPTGSFAALASASYDFPHAALFSSQPLRDYARARGHRGEVLGEVEEPIDELAPPAAAELARRERRLLFHAAPEPQAAVELGVLALSRAGELGALARVSALHATGADGSRKRLDIGGGDWMHFVTDADPRGYDVGLALLHAPAPGRAPLAMAAAGMLVVTNTFETKTAATLAGLSANLIATEPAVDAIAEGICDAVERADDVDARLRGSALSWSRHWDDSFSEPLLDRVVAFLTA